MSTSSNTNAAYDAAVSAYLAAAAIIPSDIAATATAIKAAATALKTAQADPLTTFALATQALTDAKAAVSAANAAQTAVSLEGTDLNASNKLLMAILQTTGLTTDQIAQNNAQASSYNSSAAQVNTDAQTAASTLNAANTQLSTVQAALAKLNGVTSTTTKLTTDLNATESAYLAAVDTVTTDMVLTATAITKALAALKTAQADPLTTVALATQAVADAKVAVTAANAASAAETVEVTDFNISSKLLSAATNATGLTADQISQINAQASSHNTRYFQVTADVTAVRSIVADADSQLSAAQTALAKLNASPSTTTTNNQDPGYAKVIAVVSNTSDTSNSFDNERPGASVNPGIYTKLSSPLSGPVTVTLVSFNPGLGAVGTGQAAQQDESFTYSVSGMPNAKDNGTFTTKQGDTGYGYGRVDLGANTNSSSTVNYVGTLTLYGHGYKAGDTFTISSQSTPYTSVPSTSTISPVGSPTSTQLVGNFNDLSSGYLAAFATEVSDLAKLTTAIKAAATALKTAQADSLTTFALATQAVTDAKVAVNAANTAQTAVSVAGADVTACDKYLQAIGSIADQNSYKFLISQATSYNNLLDQINTYGQTAASTITAANTQLATAQTTLVKLSATNSTASNGTNTYTALPDHTITGTYNFNKAVFSEPSSNFSVSSTATSVTLVDKVGTFGTVILNNIQRAQFNDGSVIALDFQQGQHGYLAAMLIGTVLGASKVSNYFSAVVSLVDAGQTNLQIAQLAQQLGVIENQIGTNSNKAWVNFVYKNVVGAAPDMLTEGLYVNYLNNGTYSKESLLAAAVTLADNGGGTLATQINLVGLQAQGLVYHPGLI